MNLNKSVFYILLLIIFSSCLQNGNNQSNIEKKESHCRHSMPFGDIKVCLPEVDGMHECCRNPLVQKKIKTGIVENSTILGFYINDHTFSQIKRIDSISFDNYYTIYSSNYLIGLKIGANEVKQAFAYNTQQLLREKWHDVSKRLKKEKGMSFDTRPVLIEEYSPSPKFRTGIILMKTTDARYLITSFNVIQIKNRLIFLTHYNNYNGEESITRTKSENDYFAFRLIDENS